MEVRLEKATARALLVSLKKEKKSGGMCAALNLARMHVAAAAIIQWRRQRGERIR
jgi:hypothetical protein